MSFDLVARLRLKDDFSRKMQKANRQMDATSKKTSTLSSGFKKLGGVIAGVAGTAGLAMLSRSVIQTGVDFTGTMSQVQAVTGATASELEQLSTQARQLGKDTVHSASAAADGMTYLGMAGFSTNEIMASMPGLLDLATAGALELGDAADIASNILTGFNLEADDMGRVSDVLAKAAASANTDVGQLGRGMSYVAPIAASMGISLEEVSAGIGMLSDAGIQGERAGTALRGAISQLSNPTTALQKKLSAAGLSAKDVSPRFNSLADIVQNLTDAGFTGADALELVGQEAGPGLAAMMTQGSDALRELTDELVNSEGAASKMAEEMSDNLGGDWEKFKSAITENTLALFEQAESHLRNITQTATELASKLPSAAKAVGEFIKPFMPLIKNVGIALLAIGSFMAVVGVLKLIGAGLAFLVSPIGLIIAGVTGLVFAFRKAYEHSETFRNMIDKVVSTIKGLFTGETSATDLLELIGLSPEQIERLKGFIDNVITSAIGLKDGFIDVLSTLYEAVQPILSNIGGVFSVIADVAMMVFNNIIVPAVSFMWQAFQTAWKIIGPILELLGAAIGTAFAVLKFVWDTILKPVASFLLGQFAEALNGVKPILDVVGDAFDWLGDKISGVVSWLKSVADWFKSIKVPDWVSKIGSAVGKVGSAVFGGGKSSNSHYHGIDYVPRDNYSANLHKGEAVISAQENKERQQGGGERGAPINITGNTFHVRKESDIDAIARSLAQELNFKGV